MNLALIGFMGVGKSTIGKFAAQKSQRQFFDIDEIIESQEKMTISEIFQNFGEAKFRKLESQEIKKVSMTDNAIISCGGGAVLDLENIKALKKNSKVIHLYATPEMIFQRLKNSSNRPVLNNSVVLDKIKDLLKKREPYYKNCDAQIDTTNLTIEQAADKIIGLLSK
jgi:shikimate kinase